MEEIKLSCEVITPMFIAGADGKTPELRPSEFKGMLRFWWRAAKAETDYKKLRKEEAKIFGGVGEGEGKSKVSIRITNKEIKQGEYKLLPLGGRKNPAISPTSKFDIVFSSKFHSECEFYKMFSCCPQY